MSATITLKAVTFSTLAAMAVLSIPLNQSLEHQVTFERPTDHGAAPLPVSNPTHSFWTDSSPDANPLASEGSRGPMTTDADICIIGSGLTGVSAAYHLSKAVQMKPNLGPLKTVIFEARDFCSGATGRNGGHLVSNTFFEFEANKAAWGLDDAIKSVALEDYTVSEIVGLLQSQNLGDAVDLVSGGRVHLLFTEKEVQEAHADYLGAKNAGVDVSDSELLSKEMVEERYGTSYPAYKIAGHNLWPLKLATQLFNLAKNATPSLSLHLHTRTPITSISPMISATESNSHPRRWSLHTARGSVSCSYIIHATNAYSSHLLPHLTGSEGIIPVRGQIIAVRSNTTADRLSDSGWTGNEGFEYWFPRPLKDVEKNRNPLVILGGGREYAKGGFEIHETDDSIVNEDVGRGLRSFLPSLFPGKFPVDGEPEMEWTGIMGYTKTHDPFVGPVMSPDGSAYEGQYISAGFSGHGMPRTYACAEAVVGMIAAELDNAEWSVPDWLPKHYLTTNSKEGGCGGNQHGEDARSTCGDTVLICGGTDWHPDLLEPHILRSLSNVKVVSIHASCAGCHCIVLDIEGTAWLFGRNQFSALGVSGVDFVSENAPLKIRAVDLGAEEGTRFVHAACGRSHTILVDSDGRAWTAGANNLGQCGHHTCAEVSSFKVVDGPHHAGTKEQEHVIKAAAGITFSLFLTKSGRILVKGLQDKKITQIACGQQHSIALDEEGIVYVWGYNGYCRLGLGNQQDVLTPKVVPQFTGPQPNLMGAQVIAGPSNSVVIDKQGMYWMAGKWKNTGDGSGGQPYSTFRYMQDIMGCKMLHASCGGVTHFAVAPDDEEGGVMTIAWGQNAANGELGLGPNEPKSATKPGLHRPLGGIDIIDIAAGQNTTYFLATPNEKLSDLPRHPADLEAPEVCVECKKDDGDPLACDKCDAPYHLGCLDPPLDAIPDGEWFCPDCERRPGAPVGDALPPPQIHKRSGAGTGKRKARPASDADIDEEDEEDEDAGKSRKRKAPAKKDGVSKRKK
ncbi:hypothetical protein EW146_g3855 [Bondarzewia mesenterica]|uniref:PHD-type domain-containing protein n=1 Tax=Bondarzewia mesenterica TaxID=1095465 RepID=A0A4S4LXJ7_9AGAM|nr:hypothetical protein EW146_g3855 [Bondarzewia mesenterica]